ncbi:MAG: hypothetical protein LBF93_10910 [Zoogloeaceae bacterium]|jgi:hypothetical protein|nr:hypothetical protein [Zoogloeaceae bacterium]
MPENSKSIFAVDAIQAEATEDGSRLSAGSERGEAVSPCPPPPGDAGGKR